MLTLKTSIAAAILVGTAAISAGAGYLAAKATMSANVAVNCPAPTQAAPAQSHGYPPIGNLPSTTAGKQW